MTGYIFAGKAVTQKPVKGCFVDICQVGVTFSRFARMPIYKTDAHLNEWYANTKWWIDRIAMTFGKLELPDDTRQAAKQLIDTIPYNSESCFLCSYRSICASPPGSRSIHLQQLEHKPWDTTRSME
jgi:hypothetical protein